MNKRIFWSLVTATTMVAGSVWGATATAGGPGMMSGYGAGPGMMYAAPTATRPTPYSAGPNYYGRGPGMMGAYGGHGMRPGMMGGYGRYGMGPGMMGGYGMGPGMMGGYGMGPGMMGGYGMGLGMMGGYGMGLGMMGGHGGYALGLSAEQRGKIASVWNSAISKAWPIMGQLREQTFQFAQLVAEEEPDRASVNKVYARISDLRRQLLDIRLDAREKILEVLTADQRKALQKGFYHRWQ